MERLYKPRGRVQESAKVLQSIERLEREISESRAYLSKYMAADSKLLETGKSIGETEQKRAGISVRLVLLRKAQDIRPQWLKWKELRSSWPGFPKLQVTPRKAS